MNFFIPSVKDESEALSVYKSIKDFARDNGFACSKRRIYSLKFNHDAKQSVATIGEQLNSGSYKNHELVIAILETTNNMYLVCTPNCGVERGLPILVSEHDTIHISDFD